MIFRKIDDFSDSQANTIFHFVSDPFQLHLAVGRLEFFVIVGGVDRYCKVESNAQIDSQVRGVFWDKLIVSLFRDWHIAAEYIMSHSQEFPNRIVEVRMPSDQASAPLGITNRLTTRILTISE
jgi:hypothetical protein